MKPLDRKSLLNKFGFAHFTPLIDKINELVDDSNTEIIRLGAAVISHTNGVASTEVGMLENYGSAATDSNYVPTRSFVIKKFIVATNFGTLADNDVYGTFKLVTDNGTETADHTINLELDSVDLVASLNTRLVFSQTLTGAIDLDAFTSEYGVETTIAAAVVTGEYTVEVSIEVEYLD